MRACARYDVDHYPRVLRWDVEELLRTYRDGYAVPAAREQYNWERLRWASLARSKEIQGEEPKPPPILRDRD